MLRSAVLALALLPACTEEAALPPDVLVLPETVEPGVSPDVIDDLLERAAGLTPPGRPVDPWVVDGEGALHRLVDLFPETEPVAEEPGVRSFPVDLPGRAEGFLSDRAVYLSQCHGWIWYDSLGGFSTQRGTVFGTVEDFHNPEGADQYLTRYLENAGAAVFTTKERDLQENLVILDNGAAGYTETGAGFANGLAGFANTAPYPYGEDPFDAGTTRTFPAAGGGKVTWRPNVPADGEYAVYVSWDADAAHAPDAHYRLTHPGGTIDRWFDQTTHGSTWQYVETLWLPAGQSLTIELLGDSASANARLSADAVRLGGGVGDVTRYGVTTGRPRWEEGAILYTQFNGAPTSVYDPFNDGDGSDPTARSKWADWEHPAGEDAVYLSWHSNASGGAGTARGTTTYFAGGGPDAPLSHPAQCATGAIEGSYSLALTVQEELIDVFRSEWEPTWSDRGINEACFSEVSPSNNDDMPAVLVELAFHDNAADTDALKHPRFRRDASRAMYRGIVRYFAERDNVAPVYLPEPPEAPSLRNTRSGLRLSWSPGPVGAPDGDAADSYVVFTSADGRSWDGGTEVAGTTTLLEAADGEVIYARVAARNAGGLSFPAEVVGARRSPEGAAPVLVVGAFDRLDRGMLRTEDLGGSLGVLSRMDLGRMNRRDLVVAHGEAVADAGWFFDSAADEALTDLTPWDVVVWATGEESTSDETFSATQQALVEDLILAGGSLWASGAEILWDLDDRGSATDQAFAANVLGATLQSDDAGTDVVDGVGPLAGVGPLDFGDAPYPVEYPDVLSSAGTVIATYAGGDPAAVWDGSSVALFGFPFDAIRDEVSRAEVAERILPALAPNVTPPEWLGLEVSPLVAGGQAVLTATGAVPGATVSFGRGSGLGNGPCPPQLGGECLDLLNPVLIGSARADADGVAELVVPVPAGAAGATLYAQAGSGTVVSNPVTTVVE